MLCWITLFPSVLNTLTCASSCLCIYMHACKRLRCASLCMGQLALMCKEVWPCTGGFIPPREVTFVISLAQPSAQGFCQAGLSLKGPMPDHQPPHPNPKPLQSRSLHQPLALHSLDRKELTLAFKQGRAKSSCQSLKLDSQGLGDLDLWWKQNKISLHHKYLMFF